ncbi:MAG: hypothetical protein KKG00_06500 [Bacteroidetes bacterium]|nr:hypothetical protein [Bacteroidota bacterium]
MTTISKQEAGNWVLLDCLAQKQVLLTKIELLERKYTTDFETFEQSIEQAATEDFAAWDDYIEWKAYTTFLSELLLKIDDLTHGRFQVA